MMLQWYFPLLIYCNLLAVMKLDDSNGGGTARKRSPALPCRDFGLFLELMDCVEDFVVVLDRRLRVIAANRRATAFLGYSAKALVSKPLSKLIEASERRRMSEFVLGAKKRLGGEAVFLTRAFEKVRLCFSLSPMAEAGGEPQGYLLVGRPAKADSSRAPSASGGLSGLALKGFSDPLFIVDYPSRTVRDCNEAAQRVLGFSREELVGRRLFDRAGSDEERERNEALMARADAVYATAGIFRERVLFPRKDGPALPCDCLAMPFFESDGSLATIVAMLIDRSSEEEREAEIASLADRADSVARELSAIVAGYASRCKATPLSSLGFTDRQIEIARLVASGASSKDIGFRLGIAESTVKNHLAVMFRKVGAASRMSFIRILSERHIKIA
jgi:PAS domain S-box-containing protein